MAKTKMKHLLVLILAAIGVNALNQEFVEEFMEKLQALGAECAEEIHATADDIAEIIERKRPSTHEGQCMIFCIQKKLHLMEEDGNMDKVGSIMALEPLKDADFDLYKKVIRIFINCGEKAKIYDDACETGTELWMCGIEQAQAMGVDESIIG